MDCRKGKLLNQIGVIVLSLTLFLPLDASFAATNQPSFLEVSNEGIEPPHNGSSSYRSQDDAEYFSGRILASKQDDIEAWLASNPGNRPEGFSDVFNETTGRHVPRGSSTVSDVNGATIVLQVDSSRPEGYRILTGYPSE